MKEEQRMEDIVFKCCGSRGETASEISSPFDVASAFSGAVGSILPLCFACAFGFSAQGGRSTIGC